MKTEHVCAEIMYSYMKKFDDGSEHEWSVCSDLCGTMTDGSVSDEWRELLHGSLDEWLDKSCGSGMFWIGDSSMFKDGL